MSSVVAVSVPALPRPIFTMAITTVTLVAMLIINAVIENAQIAPPTPRTPIIALPSVTATALPKAIIICPTVAIAASLFAIIAVVAAPRNTADMQRPLRTTWAVVVLEAEAAAAVQAAQVVGLADAPTVLAAAVASGRIPVVAVVPSAPIVMAEVASVAAVVAVETVAPPPVVGVAAKAIGQVVAPHLAGPVSPVAAVATAVVLVFADAATPLAAIAQTAPRPRPATDVVVARHVVGIASVVAA